ncbi:sh3 and f-bar domain-containing protein [Anaeramoeba ignava]|uniref:Sh3 and f-bar domain-containing protein n=1 Tax=Anaeramoeba ignava TaxID=1746090 RepID=A0A9Q0RA91_ANAIG|nr:sh3 and f-bar domain-containing protein [Anaeramoeba ignava]
MSFSTDLRGAYPQIKTQTQTNFDALKSLADFIHKFAKLQDGFGKSIIKLVSSPKLGFENYGTIEAAFNDIKINLTQYGQALTKSSQTLLTETTKPFVDFDKETQKKRKETTKVCDKKLKELMSLKNKFDNSKLKSEKNVAETTRLEQNAQNDPKAQSKADKLRKKQEKIDDELKKAKRNLGACEDEYYNEVVPLGLADLQTIEENRIGVVQKQLQAFAADQSYLVTKYGQLNTNIQESITKINAQDDVKTLVNKYISENTTPTETSEKDTTNTSVPQPKTTSTNLTKTKTQPVNDSQTEDTEFDVKAEFDYKGTESTDLQFNSGDIVHVLKKHDQDWWEGEVNGKRGLFPANHVKPIDNDEKPQQETTQNVNVDDNIQIGDKCTVVFPYDSQADGELSIVEGETVTISRIDSGWFVGENESGQSGAFPGNYVKKV